MRWIAALLLAVFAVGAASFGAAPGEVADSHEIFIPALTKPEPPLRLATKGGTCLNCHKGIEDIHPSFELTCVECHGGDDTAATKEKKTGLEEKLGVITVFPRVWVDPVVKPIVADTAGC